MKHEKMSTPGKTVKPKMVKGPSGYQEAPKKKKKAASMTAGGMVHPKAMMGGGKVQYAAGGKKMHPKMVEQQNKMKMDAEYKSAGGMIFKGR
jgi:hypothetical protein